MVNKWKITAIIFITLFILETIFLVWAISYGTGILEKETECSINICADYEAFYFDDTENVCYCYLDNEIAHQEYVK